MGWLKSLTNLLHIFDAIWLLKLVTGNPLQQYFFMSVTFKCVIEILFRSIRLFGQLDSLTPNGEMNSIQETPIEK